MCALKMCPFLCFRVFVQCFIFQLLHNYSISMVVESDTVYLHNHQLCGTIDHAPDDILRINNEMEQLLIESDNFNFNVLADTYTIIPTYFHIILNSNGEGSISDDDIKNQINVLKRICKPFGFNLSLRGIDRITNDAWFSLNLNSNEENEMKSTLRKGTAQTLNIYTSGLTNFLLGWGTYPSGYSSNPKSDGIVILYSSLPNGQSYPYNKGYTLVHEFGHWLGLYHPFQGGCSILNDGIADTPALAGPTYGCPTNNPNSCISLPGLDPINNYMNYSDDLCMIEFTIDQINMMKNQWKAYRQNK